MFQFRDDFVLSKKYKDLEILYKKVFREKEDGDKDVVMLKDRFVKLESEFVDINRVKNVVEGDFMWKV